MRVLHLTKSVVPQSAAYRLHKGLENMGIQSSIMVNSKSILDEKVIDLSKCNKRRKALALVCKKVDALFTSLYSNCRHIFSPGLFSDDIVKEIEIVKPDVIHLHWICAGFISIRLIKKIYKLSIPIVWTIHDSWPFTGGCHVPFECNNYKNECHNCPVLQSNFKYDLSYFIWRYKRKYWENISFNLVTPSKWMGDCVASSSLLRKNKVQVIHNGIDIDLYKPMDKKIARDILGISQDKYVILFGAVSISDPNKGFEYLKEAFQYLSLNNTLNSICEGVVFGSSKPSAFQNLGIPIRYVGFLNDDISLKVLYSAADIMVVPSLQESFGQTVMEAMACGVPCCSFSTSGLLDIIDHQVNGYLANAFIPEDLARGIVWVLKDKSKWKHLSINAREKVVKKFNIHDISRQYINFYQDILKKDSFLK